MFIWELAGGTEKSAYRNHKRWYKYIFKSSFKSIMDFPFVCVCVCFVDECIKLIDSESGNPKAKLHSYLKAVLFKVHWKVQTLGISSACLSGWVLI